MELKIADNVKILYINYLIEIHNPDHIIIWETWLENKPTGINSLYEVFQIKYSKYQGVWIIIERTLPGRYIQIMNSSYLQQRSKQENIHTKSSEYIFNKKEKSLSNWINS